MHECDVGCVTDCASLQHDPPCFGNYYQRQLDAITWAQQELFLNTPLYDAEPLPLVDFSHGVGIAGHSMGGQATLFSSAYFNTSAHDIRAAVLHHAYSHTFPAPTVPYLVFTGAEDTTASAEDMAVPMFEAGSTDPTLPRGHVLTHIHAHAVQWSHSRPPEPTHVHTRAPARAHTHTHKHKHTCI